MLNVIKSGTSPSKPKEIQDLLDNDDIDDLERDPDNEDVYDFFLEAHQEENRNANAGYHIIDQEDLEGSGAHQKQDGQLVDEDDLDNIMDEELK
jgi:hypothetical protein